MKEIRYTKLLFNLDSGDLKSINMIALSRTDRSVLFQYDDDFKDKKRIKRENIEVFRKVGLKPVVSIICKYNDVEKYTPLIYKEAKAQLARIISYHENRKQHFSGILKAIKQTK